MASTQQHHFQQQQQEEAVLHSCLSLLDVAHAEGAKGVDVSRSMFRKPNPRALELILYHTYCVVKGKAAAKRFFKGLWPLTDKDRKQAKDFYQRAQDWLKESGQLAEHGHSLAAFQRNPSGSKLVSFLCDLTDWALCTQHERMFPDDPLPQHSKQDPQLVARLCAPLLAAAEAHNQLQAERLTRLCQEGSQLQAQAEAAADQLKELFYSLTAQLREAQAQAEAAGLDPGQLPAAPSIKLPNILPEQRQECSTSDSSRPAAAQPSLPEALRQQQAHAAELWQALDAHMQGFSQLAELSASLLGCDAHPHAIDATQLRAAGQLWGAPPAAGLDVAALVEAWLYDVGSVCRYVKTLAGQCADVGQQQAHQARGWLPVRAPGSSSSGGGGGGIGRSCFMTPLVATGDASSHATHLYAQLQLHSASRDGLLALRSTLGQQLEDTAAQVDQLQAKLLPVIAEQSRQEAQLAEEAAAAAEAAALHDGDPQQQLAAEAAAAAGGRGLFASSGMQLVPPTPLLQQAAHKRTQQQQEQRSGLQPPSSTADVMGQQQHYPRVTAGALSLPVAAPAAAAGVGGAASGLPPSPTTSAGGAAGGVSYSAAGSPSGAQAAAGGGFGSPGCVLLPEAAGASPRMPASPTGSTELPVGELLMSRELMDLDLVDDDGGLEDEDDGGVFSACRGSALRGAAAVAAAGGQAGGDHLSRISFARFSLCAGALAPALKAAREGREGAVAEEGEEASLQQQQQRGGSLPAAQEESEEDEGAQPRQLHDGGEQPGSPGAAAVAAVAAAGSDGASDSGDDDAGAFSPPEVGPAASADLTPGSAPLSSAKPRRLTFAAAAASGGTQRMPSGLSGVCEGDSPSLALSGCVGVGGTPADADTAESGNAALALLRQRFQTAQKSTKEVEQQ